MNIKQESSIRSDRLSVLKPHSSSCKCTICRQVRDSELDDREVLFPGTPKVFTIDNFAFGYKGHKLNKAQKKLIHQIALYIFRNQKRIKKIAIKGYASGYRNLAKHANGRAQSVHLELEKSLLGFGANSRLMGKLTMRNPATKYVSSERKSKPADRKVEILIFNTKNKVDSNDKKFKKRIRQALINLRKIVPNDKIPNPRSSKVINAINRDRGKRRTARILAIQCILRKVSHALKKNTSFNDCYVDTSPPHQRLRCQKRFVKELKRRYLEKSQDEFYRGIFKIYLEIEKPIDDTYQSFRRVRTDSTDIAVINTPECFWIRFFKKKARDPNNIYHCLRRQLAAFAPFCDY